VMCEIMAGALVGGQRTDEPRKGGVLNSLFAVLIDVSRLGSGGGIQAAIEASKQHIRSARTAPGFEEILLPGEPERRAAATRAAGIPIDDRTWQQVVDAAGKLGITAAELEQAND
jgi:hydroxycarboxylate dehydrogenase B